MIQVVVDSEAFAFQAVLEEPVEYRDVDQRLESRGPRTTGRRCAARRAEAPAAAWSPRAAAGTGQPWRGRGGSRSLVGSPIKTEA